MRNIAIYGAGGYGREIACLIKHINQANQVWNIIGFFDDGIPTGTVNEYGKVLGSIEQLNAFDQPLSIVIAIANPEHIKKIATSINNSNISFPNLIAPNSIIFDENTLRMGKGNIIFFGCRLSCDVKIGSFNLLNGLVSLGHDVEIGNYNVLQPSVRLSGGSKVGHENFFGVQAIVLQGITIGNNTRVGANSVVMNKTKDYHLYFGNPAKIVRM